MPASFTYGLYPFAWDAAAKCHKPPSGASCVLDFRSLSQQATQGQSAGYGLFAWASSPPGDLVSLGTGYAPTLSIDNAARLELKQKLGLGGKPSGATLADALSDVLGSLADPTGASGPKPLMPSSDGTLEIHLDGHSRIWAVSLDAAELLSANPRGRANRIRDVIRADLDVAEAIGGASLLQKSLGAVLKKCGYSDAELKAGAPERSAEWQRLLSAGVKAKHGANAKPAKPTTSVTESWPNPTADLSSTAQDRTWSVLATDGFANGLKVASNTMRATSAFTRRLGICATAVSSADHYAEARITCVTGGGEAYATARQHASRGSFYAAGWNYSTARRLYKCVLGTLTQLATATVSDPASVLVRCDCNGSTITGSWPSLADQSVTDTSVTGNLQGGGWIYLDAGVETYGQIGAWALDDGLSGGGGGGSGGLCFKGC